MERSGGGGPKKLSKWAQHNFVRQSEGFKARAIVGKYRTMIVCHKSIIVCRKSINHLSRLYKKGCNLLDGTLPPSRVDHDGKVRNDNGTTVLEKRSLLPCSSTPQIQNHHRHLTHSALTYISTLQPIKFVRVWPNLIIAES